MDNFVSLDGTSKTSIDDVDIFDVACIPPQHRNHMFLAFTNNKQEKPSPFIDIAPPKLSTLRWHSFMICY
jgi:hypothetical protein